MKNPEEHIETVVNALRDEVAPETDRRIWRDLAAIMDRKRTSATQPVRSSFWVQLRQVARNPLVGVWSVAVLVAGMVVAFVVLKSSMTPAYALADTLQAMDRVQTVHMAGELYQGKFECWMRFEDNPDQPSYLWMEIPRIPNLQRICTPTLSYAFNPRTKAAYECQRDERKQPWIIRFNRFFKDAIETARDQNAATITRETDPQSGRELIAVLLRTTNREQKVLVDPDTRLPVKFTTLRDDAPDESMKRGLAIRHLDWIRYNERIPAGLFEMPPDAVRVSEEPDVLVTPENGIDATGLSREAACRALAERMGRAMVEGDIGGLRQCAPFFWVMGDDVFAKARVAAEKSGRIPVEFVIRGEAYQEGEHWFIPCRVVNRNGSREDSTAMIKFYRFGPVERCAVIGSKEKGMYD